MRARRTLRWLFLGLAVTIAAGAVALLLVLRDFKTTQALMPLPIQPFQPEQQGGISTTQLGQPITDTAITEISRGERLGQNWWAYSAPGFQAARDADISDGIVVGGVTAQVDALCDSAPDTFAAASSPPPDFVPFEWREATTAVEGTTDEFLETIMPPFPFVLRHEAEVTNIWLFDAVPYTTWPLPMNTVYSAIPWSPNHSALIATTKFDWRWISALPSPSGAVCLDSPWISTSTTTVYSNPSLKGDNNSDTIDDATGLYPRWAAFQSDPDDRKPFQSPPSIASDTGYVERVVRLQCYWLDEDGASDVNGDGYVDPGESLADDDMPAGADDDHDCLADTAFAQPGRPVDSDDQPNGTLCAPIPYGQEPNVIRYDTAADQDCDGLLDGIEKAWGSNPLVADSDGDGATDFVEMFQFTNPLVTDTDGDGLRDKPDDDYVNAPIWSAEAGEGVNADDNCPTEFNPDQANSDGRERWVSSSPASNPNQDKLGDACDPDDDNDAAADLAEMSMGTDSKSPDTDGDGCLDGIEGYVGSDPTLSTSNCPSTLNNNQIKFFRGCHWNLPPNGYGGGLWDAEYDGSDDNVEWDPEGDGVLCQTGTSITDTDNDNDQASDNVEIMMYNLNPANKDTDGDGCEDGVEIHDTTGACIPQPTATPTPPPADADGDGVPDAQDACPNTPPSTPVDAQGCPEFGVWIDADARNGAAPCNPVDTTANVAAGAHEVAICISSPADNVGAFSVTLRYDDTINQCVDKVCATSGGTMCVDDNPDANTGLTLGSGVPTTPNLGGGWDCSGFGSTQPRCDVDAATGPAHGAARIDCLSTTGPYTSPTGGVSFPLAVVTLDTVGNGADNMRLSDVVIGDWDGHEMGSCNPIIAIGIPCWGAKVTKVTPTPPPADADGDGVPDALDDCPNTPPGTQVDARGCPIGTLPALKWPLPGQPTDSNRQGYWGFGAVVTGSDCGGLPKLHAGKDLKASPGENVYAAASGTVRGFGSSGAGWGQFVTIEHDGFTTVYHHVVPAVSEGQPVIKGQVIATIADIDSGTPDHLHFGVRVSPYSNIANRGWLPQVNSSESPSCQDDPLFPEEFVDPMTLTYESASSPWVKVSNTPTGIWRLRQTPGTENKPAEDVLMIVPNDWGLLLKRTTDNAGQAVSMDGYTWWQVENVASGVTGWMAAASTVDGTQYLTQGDPLTTQEVTTQPARADAILDSLNDYYNGTDVHSSLQSTTSLYGSNDWGYNANNPPTYRDPNNLSYLKENGFPVELVLAIAAGESGDFLLDNQVYGEDVLGDYLRGGVGIMQVTSEANRGWGSDLKCYTTACRAADSNQKYQYPGGERYHHKYYTNTLQGIYANIKDGLRNLQFSYAQSKGLNADAMNAWIGAVWRYNIGPKGCAVQKNSPGLATKVAKYIGAVVPKINTLNNYFGDDYKTKLSTTLLTDGERSQLIQRVTNYVAGTFCSAGEMRVYDSQGRLTGVVDGAARAEIPNSDYTEGGFLILAAADSYAFEVVGTDEGTYDFTVTSIENDQGTSFAATGIPIHPGAIHIYTVNWDALSRGEEGIALHLDSNGDGVFEETVAGDSDLTYTEFVSQVDSDGDGVADAAADPDGSGPIVAGPDNCPLVANADQTNTDGGRRPNGSQVDGEWASNPARELIDAGDACDPDDDNDALPDSSENDSVCPFRTVSDSDGDGCLDGAEFNSYRQPCDPASKVVCSSSTDTDGDGFTNCVEHAGYSTCAFVGDTTPGWTTCADPADSDGDSCADWIEIVDINGNRQADILDVLFVVKRAFNLIPASDSDVVLDMDKNGSVNLLDGLVAAKNSNLVRSHSPCSAE